MALGHMGMGAGVGEGGSGGGGGELLCIKKKQKVYMFRPKIRTDK